MKSQRIKDVIRRKEKLEWYVDFANMNLETIKPGDKAKLLIESAGHLYPDIELSDQILIDILTSQEEPKMAKEEAKILLSITNKFLNKEQRERWEVIFNLQKVIEELFHNLQKSDELTYCKLDDMNVRMVWGENQPFEFTYYPRTDNHEQWVRLWIYNLLDGLPGHTINICPVCNKFFLNMSFRKKEFCSPNCMWKNNSAKQRKKDPEKYRKYQRELMRKKSIKKNELENQKLKEPKQRSKTKGGK